VLSADLPKPLRDAWLKSTTAVVRSRLPLPVFSFFL